MEAEYLMSLQVSPDTPVTPWTATTPSGGLGEVSALLLIGRSLATGYWWSRWNASATGS